MFGAVKGVINDTLPLYGDLPVLVCLFDDFECSERLLTTIKVLHVEQPSTTPTPGATPTPKSLKKRAQDQGRERSEKLCIHGVTCRPLALNVLGMDIAME